MKPLRDTLRVGLSTKILLKLAAFSVITLITAFFAGSYGYSAGKATQLKRDIIMVKHWVATAEFPTVRMVKQTHEAISVTEGGVCYPVGPSYRLPAAFHVHYVSPYARPCGGGGTAGQPYHNSKALQAIQNRIEGVN